MLLEWIYAAVWVCFKFRRRGLRHRSLALSRMWVSEACRCANVRMHECVYLLACFSGVNKNIPRTQSHTLSHTHTHESTKITYAICARLVQYNQINYINDFRAIRHNIPYIYSACAWTRRCERVSPASSLCVCVCRCSCAQKPYDKSRGRWCARAFRGRSVPGIRICVTNENSARTHRSIDGRSRSLQSEATVMRPAVIRHCAFMCVSVRGLLHNM